MEKPNNNYIDELTDGDQDFRTEVIAVLKEDLPIEVAEYYEAIMLEDDLKTALIVHKLKHKISILGLEKGLIIAENYEKELKQNTVTLQEDFEKIIQQILDFVSNLK